MRGKESERSAKADCLQRIPTFRNEVTVLLKTSRKETRSLGLTSLALFSCLAGNRTGELDPRTTKEDLRQRQIIQRESVLVYAGLGGIFFTAFFAPQLGTEWAGWCGIAALLATIHFGLSGVLTVLIRLTGRPAELLFNNRPRVQRYSNSGRSVGTAPLSRWIENSFFHG